MKYTKEELLRAIGVKIEDTENKHVGSTFDDFLKEEGIVLKEKEFPVLNTVQMLRES